MSSDEQATLSVAKQNRRALEQRAEAAREREERIALKLAHRKGAKDNGVTLQINTPFDRVAAEWRAVHDEILEAPLDRDLNVAWARKLRTAQLWSPRFVYVTDPSELTPPDDGESNQGGVERRPSQILRDSIFRDRRGPVVAAVDEAVSAAAQAREAAVLARKNALKSVKKAKASGKYVNVVTPGVHENGPAKRRNQPVLRRRKFNQYGKAIRTSAELASPIRNLNNYNVRPKSAHAVLTRGAHGSHPIHSNEPPPSRRPSLDLATQSTTSAAGSHRSTPRSSSRPQTAGARLNGLSLIHI